MITTIVTSWMPTLLFFLHSLFSIQCSPSTNPIFTESGVGPSNTYHFITESPWKLDWTAEGKGSFAVYSRSFGGDKVKVLNLVGVDLAQPRTGTTWVYDISGPMYLQMDGSNAGYIWTVEVSR